MFFLILNACLCGILICLCAFYSAVLPVALASLAVLVWRTLSLFHQSRRDALTGLWNRRRLDDLRRTYSKCAELGVWYFDLYHLKQINDTAGHADGDRMLLAAAAALRSTDLPKAMAYRIGGDEFLLVIPYRADPVSPLPDPDHISVSWGFACGQGSMLDALIVRAERDMYENRRMKESERNTTHPAG